MSAFTDPDYFTAAFPTLFPFGIVPFCEADQATNFEAHFASALALRRLCASVNARIYDSMSNSDTSTSEEFGGPTANTLRSLAALTQWRGLLPRDLQWPDDDPAPFPAPQTVNPRSFNEPVDPSLSIPRPLHPGAQLFSTDLKSPPPQPTLHTGRKGKGLQDPPVFLARFLLST
ncbi:hypothetical protein BKA64DRAFT_714093 [Cadophora sp. MPI-SDFR-AT-0126]|nr:hypothetical protein BKA64DRAFT_714093 [Leotiomycetes sp. MPI-SDFR-AT-0126]